MSFVWSETPHSDIFILIPQMHLCHFKTIVVVTRPLYFLSLDLYQNVSMGTAQKSYLRLNMNHQDHIHYWLLHLLRYHRLMQNLVTTCTYVFNCDVLCFTVIGIQYINFILIILYTPSELQVLLYQLIESIGQRASIIFSISVGDLLQS